MNTTIRINAVRQRMLAACIAAVCATAVPEVQAALPKTGMALDTSRVPDITVTNCDDSGPGSLRDALNGASDGDIIDLTQLACSTISLTTGALVFGASDVAVIGPGRFDLTVDASGSPGYAAFYDLGGGTLHLANMTITGGSKYRSDVDAKGGCVHTEANVALENVEVKFCFARRLSLQRARRRRLRRRIRVPQPQHDLFELHGRRPAMRAAAASMRSAACRRCTARSRTTSSLAGGGTPSFGGGAFVRGGGFHHGHDDRQQLRRRRTHGRPRAGRQQRHTVDDHQQHDLGQLRRSYRRRLRARVAEHLQQHDRVQQRRAAGAMAQDTISVPASTSRRRANCTARSSPTTSTPIRRRRRRPRISPARRARASTAATTT